MALTSKLQVKMSLRKCHTFVPNLRAIQRNSSHHSIHQKSSHRSIRHNSNHRSRKRQWYRHVLIPEFLSLSLISSFQDLGDQFSMFCPCVSLWHLGSHFWFVWIFLWIFHCFLYSCLCPHSWTMTALFGFAIRLLACALACIAVSLKMCNADLMTLTLCQTRERERVDRINIHGI